MLQLLSWPVRLAALAGALAGCAADPVDGPGAGGSGAGGEPPRIELGTGLTEHIALPREGGAVEIVSGIQGGFHVDLTARLHGLDPEGLALSYAVRDLDTGEVVSLPATYTLSARRVIDEGDHLLRVGDRAVLDIPSPAALAGRPAELSCAALRGEEELASDLRRVTLVDAIDELP